MNSFSLACLLSAHILGDFYFQSERLAQKKASSYRYTLRHILIYSGVMLASGLFLTFYGYQLSWFVWLLLILSHGLIDLIKCLINKSSYMKVVKPGWLYVGDQLLHLSFIVLSNLFIEDGFFDFEVSRIDGLFLSKCLLFALIIFKPANITFKLLFGKYQYDSTKIAPDNTQEIKLATTVAGAGAVIGNLERLIIGIFLLLNQYGAIGLILTAKSITRYNKIATSPAFSEYYLIGTLYSLLATLLPYLVIFQPVILKG